MLRDRNFLLAWYGLSAYNVRLMDNVANVKRELGFVPSMLVGAALGLVVCILFGVALVVWSLMF